MQFAVVLYLDELAASIVEKAQRAIVQAGLSPDTRVLEFRPHISLAICDRLDVGAFEPYLSQFAASTPPIGLNLSRLGAFPTDPAVLFLEPAVSMDLAAAHQRFHRRFLKFAEDPSKYYLPGQWVPHCTLVERLSPADVPQAVKLCKDLPLPLHVRLEEVALAEFYPEKLCYSFELGNS